MIGYTFLILLEFSSDSVTGKKKGNFFSFEIYACVGFEVFYIKCTYIG